MDFVTLLHLNEGMSKLQLAVMILCVCLDTLLFNINSPRKPENFQKKVGMRMGIVVGFNVIQFIILTSHVLHVPGHPDMSLLAGTIALGVTTLLLTSCLVMSVRDLIFLRQKEPENKNVKNPFDPPQS
jgi:hypothetical protein